MKREILDHLISLRFSISAILILILMVCGTIVSEKVVKVRMERYGPGEIKGFYKAKIWSAVSGLGFYRRKPSPLGFIAMEDELIWPFFIARGGILMSGFGEQVVNYTKATNWALDYLGATFFTSEESSLFPISMRDASFPPFIPMDWAFVIGVLGALMAILFTYDSISGERERGTLKLLISNPVPRSHVILGKLLGAMVVLTFAIGFGCIISLLIAMRITPLGKEDWIRLLLILLFSLLYIAIFVFIGISISSRFRSSMESLAILLIIWMVFVILMPKTIEFVYMETIPHHPYEDILSISTKMEDEIDNRYREKGLFDKVPPWEYGKEAIELWRRYLNEFERIPYEVDRMFDKRVAIVERARMWSRLSPASIYRYGLEAIAGTSLPGYMEFVTQIRQYIKDTLNILKKADMDDPNSLHIFWMKEGMSQREVELPRFKQGRSFLWMIRKGMLDMMIILILFIGMFLLSYFSFMKADVR